MKRQLKTRNVFITLIVIVIGLLLGLNNTEVQEILGVIEKPGYWRVSSVSDGDTIVVTRKLNTETVRLIGVDTPETHHPSKPVQCFGESASVYLENRLLNQSVRLEKDVESDNRDIYGRLLRYVYLDNQLVNQEIIEEGYGFAYLPFKFTKLKQFEESEISARQNKLGLWRACSIEIDGGVLNTNPAV